MSVRPATVSSLAPPIFNECGGAPPACGSLGDRLFGSCQETVVHKVVDTTAYMQWMNLPASRMFYDNMYLTGGTSFSTTRSLDFLLDAPPSLAKASSLITIQWLTLPIMATQSDFHDLVGAACSQLSRNYSPCMYRKVLISSTTFGSHTDGLTE